MKHAVAIPIKIGEAQKTTDKEGKNEDEKGKTREFAHRVQFSKVWNFSYTKRMKLSIRTLYLYLFSFVGLLIAVIGCIQIVNLGLKTYIFKEADRVDYYVKPIEAPGEAVMSTEEAKLSEEKQKESNRQQTQSQRQRELANSLAMIVVGVPLYWYHWKTIEKEKGAR